MRLRQYWIQGLKLLFLRPKRFCRCKKKQFLADAQPFSKYEKSVNNNNKASSWIDRLFKKAENSHLQDEIKTYLAEPVIPNKFRSPVVLEGKTRYFSEFVQNGHEIF